MVSYASLLLPIVVSAVAVFVLSSIVHMVLPFHRADYRQLPNEADIQEALRKANVQPGDYMLPCPPPGGAAMKDPTFLERLKAGPNASLTVRAGGMPKMGKYLGLWFLYLLVVSALVAFGAMHAVSPGAPAAGVFHGTAFPAFLAFSLAHWQDQIWYEKSLGTTVRNTVDGLIYGIATGLVFMWMWPKV